MNNLIIILKDDYGTFILSIISYIFFRVINRVKFKNKINIKHEFMLILFIIYLLILFNVVTYPVNDYGDNNFNLFKEIMRYKMGSNLFIQNILGNILMFMPFGMFLNAYFNIKRLPLIIITILYSLSIEITQMIIGRVFDVDDIILNLVGAIIGWYFSKYIK